MPISSNKIKIDLRAARPTELTVELLKSQLTAVGLTCSDADESKLSAYIEDVKSKLPKGKVQTFSILRPTKNPANVLRGLGANLARAATGNWEPSEDALGYLSKLAVIQYARNFKWLKDNQPGFLGNYGTSIDKKAYYENVEAVLSNILEPLNEDSVKDYKSTDSRVIGLVSNYNPESGNADAIGVLTLEWILNIKDYKKKKGNLKHETTIKMDSRAVLYDDIDFLNAHYKRVLEAFPNSSRSMDEEELAFFGPLPPTPEVPIENRIISPISRKMKIFDKLPPPILDTFQQSLLKKSTTNTLEAIVLYAPDLKNIGCIDNTQSKAAASYAKAVTSGFTFSATQTFSTESSVEASVEVVKVGFKVGFSLSFNEQWSESITETVSFEVPAGEKAYLYQGYMLAKTLIQDNSNGTFRWGNETAKFVTNILATHETPLLDL